MDKAQFCKKIEFYINDEAEAHKDYLNFARDIAQNTGNPDLAKDMEQIAEQEATHHDFFAFIFNTYCETTALNWKKLRNPKTGNLIDGAEYKGYVLRMAHGKNGFYGWILDNISRRTAIYSIENKASPQEVENALIEWVDNR